MPLIVLTGYPSSGKTTRSQQIKEYLVQRLALEKRDTTVHVINDDTLKISKEAYKDPREEKKARGSLLSAVERMLTKETVVIADGLNYIKGFRYQLYCVARALGTPQCTIHTGVPHDVVKEWNRLRTPEDQYDESILEELIHRYEEPDQRNRWDSPLFTIVCDDENIPGDQIWDAVILRKAPPPNLSTVSKPVSGTDYVYERDRITREMISAVIEAQRDKGVGGESILLSATSVHITNPSRTLTLSELRRYRSQFARLNKTGTAPDINNIADMFADYLNTVLDV